MSNKKCQICKSVTQASWFKFMNNTTQFCIQNRQVGKDSPCFIIAEIGLAHEGSLGMAHAYIDAAQKAGADAVKFQTHIAEAEGTSLERFRVPCFPQDKTRADYWRRTAFTEEEWVGLKKHCDDVGCVFLSSPFSLEALELLERIKTPAWKVASGEVSNLPLLQAMMATKLPILLSSGMSTVNELDRAVSLIQEKQHPLAIFQCTNRYPCPPESWGLNLIGEFQERYKVPVGFSDHSGTLSAGIGAVVLGASLLEVHVCWHKSAFGPDVSSSLTIDELTLLIREIRQVKNALNNPVNKNKEALALSEVRELFSKSIVAKTFIPAGTVLEQAHFAYKKPNMGISAAESDTLIGRHLVCDLEQDQFIQWDMLA